MHAARRRGTSDTRLMVRIAQMYYRMHLSQEQIGERLGLSRFQVGRLLDRAIREEIVRIEVVHPDARLVELEDALVARFGLAAAVVADVPAATGAGGGRRPGAGRGRGGAVDFLAGARPRARSPSPGAARCSRSPAAAVGWTQATEIVQLNGATSRSAPAHARERDPRALRRHDRRHVPDARRARDRRHAGAARRAAGGSRDPRDDRCRPIRAHRRLRAGHPGAGQPAPRRPGS